MTTRRSNRRGHAPVEYVALTGAVMLAGILAIGLAAVWLNAAHRLSDTFAGWTLM